MLIFFFFLNPDNSHLSPENAPHKHINFLANCFTTLQGFGRFNPILSESVPQTSSKSPISTLFYCQHHVMTDIRNKRSLSRHMDTLDMYPI